MARWLRILLQVLVGLVVLGTGVGKALDLPGFVAVLASYRALPDAALWPLAVAVTGGELVLGGWLLAGVRLRLAALASAVVAAGYALWLTAALLRGLRLDNCGCFGVYLARPLTWWSPVEDLVMIGASVLLMRLAPRSGAGARAESAADG